jgi:hypothetical protein
MDLVAHCGWSGAGQFLYTLSTVDVATGWVACAGLRDKRSEVGYDRLGWWPALAALERIHDLAGDFLHPVRKLVSNSRSATQAASGNACESLHQPLGWRSRQPHIPPLETFVHGVTEALHVAFQEHTR